MKAILKLQSALGYTWAALCLIIILGTFLGLNSWEQILAKRAGIHVSPRFSGGEVRQTVDHGMYQTLVHRPVFDGLLGERTEGFVQIDWVPHGKQTLPAILEEEVDIDGDAAIEISLRIDTARNEVQLTRRAPWVLDAEPLIAAGAERILRVQLRNPHQ
jgi:hypothetical protein